MIKLLLIVVVLFISVTLIHSDINKVTFSDQVSRYYEYIRTFAQRKLGK